MGERRSLSARIIKWGSIATALTAIITFLYFGFTYSLEYVAGKEIPYASAKQVDSLELRTTKALTAITNVGNMAIDLKLDSCMKDKTAAIDDIQRNPTSKDARLDLEKAQECIDRINKLH